MAFKSLESLCVQITSVSATGTIFGATSTIDLPETVMPYCASMLGLSASSLLLLGSIRAYNNIRKGRAWYEDLFSSDVK